MDGGREEVTEDAGHQRLLDMTGGLRANRKVARHPRCPDARSPGPRSPDAQVRRSSGDALGELWPHEGRHYYRGEHLLVTTIHR